MSGPLSIGQFKGKAQGTYNADEWGCCCHCQEPLTLVETQFYIVEYIGQPGGVDRQSELANSLFPTLKYRGLTKTPTVLSTLTNHICLFFTREEPSRTTRLLETTQEIPQPLACFSRGLLLPFPLRDPWS
jgi:hypothetical protein